MTASALFDEVRAAWASIPAPPAEDMAMMQWGWGEKAARAFTGVAPVDVDFTAAGFDAALPLFDLPPRAAAAYLGTFLLSLLKGLEFQHKVGLFTDILSRAHTITCLTLPHFWETTIRPFLPPQCRDVLVRVVAFLVTQREELALTQEQVDRMLTLAAARG